VYGADTETCPFRRGLKAPPLVCVSYAKFQQTQPVAQIVNYWDALDVCRMLFTETSVWANAPFDLAVIGNQFPELIPLIFDALDNDRIYDVQTRQRLIDIAKGNYYGFYFDPSTKKSVKIGYTVKDLAKRLLRRDIEKEDTWRKKYGLLRETPVAQWPKAAQEYSQLDSEILIHLFEDQEQYSEMLKDQFRQVRADMALHLMSCWGVRTSREAVVEIDKRSEAEFKLLQRELEKLDLVRKGAGSRNTTLAKQLLLKHLPRDQIKLTKTGERKVYAETMTRDQAIDKGYVSLDEDSCVSSKHPGLVKYARYGSVMKLRSTYVQAMWNGVTTPLQPWYLILVETGRTSCSDPNMQNFPREPGIRECCTPRDGYVYVAADYDKAELVSLAESCIEFVGYSRLGGRLLEGFDPHLDLGAQVLGINYETAELWKKQGGRYVAELSKHLGVPFKFPSKVDLPEGTDYINAVFEHVASKYSLKMSAAQLDILQRLDDTSWSRQMAKAGNFGFPGGLGPETFVEYAKSSYGVILTIDEAIALRRAWHHQWPEMQDYFRFINDLLDGGVGYVIQPISERWRGDVSYTQCCNGFFQQRTADGAKAACYEVTKRQFTQRQSALWGSHLVVFVHDELILETPEERCHEASIELSNVMIGQFQRFHPNMAAAVKATPVAMRYWSKEAKPTYDENNRLVPWGEKRFLDNELRKSA